jgi:hypothetical protein
MKKRWLIIVCLTVSFALALALSTMLTGTPAATAFDSPLPKPSAFLPHVTKQQQAAGSPHNLPGDRVSAEGNPAP